MNNNIIIKTAASQDASIIQMLAQEIWMQHYTPIIGKAQVDYMLDKFQSKDAVVDQISNGYIYYIAYDDSTPCGYSGIKEENGVFLSKLYVRQAHRGKGIGKALLTEILAYANLIKASRIWLTCNKQNTNTLSVYQKLGFNVTDNRVSDIGNGFVMDDYILEKPL